MALFNGSNLEEWLGFWRDTVTNFNSTNLSNTAVQIFPANPRRIAFGFAAMTANRATMGFGFDPVDNQSLNIGTGITTTFISIFDFGEAIQREIKAILNAVGPTRLNSWEVISNRL